MELAVWQNGAADGKVGGLVAPVGLTKKRSSQTKPKTVDELGPEANAFVQSSNIQSESQKDSSPKRVVSAAWIKDGGFQPGMEGANDAYARGVPPLMVNVVRDSGPPPEFLHGDPSKFLRKTSDPMDKVYGNLANRNLSARKSRDKISAWKPSHAAPLQRTNPYTNASELPRRKTVFYKMYELGHFSFVRVKFNGSRDGLRWSIPIKKLPVDYILPFFLEGIREPTEPARYIAVQGMQDLIYGASKVQLLDSASDCGQSLRDAIQTREPVTVTLALIAMRKLIKRDPRVVHDLMSYLPRMASPLSLFRGSKLQVQPGYDRRQTVIIGEVLSSVLGSFAEHGGLEAEQIIRRYMPDWQSINREGNEGQDNQGAISTARPFSAPAPKKSPQASSSAVCVRRAYRTGRSQPSKVPSAPAVAWR